MKRRNQRRWYHQSLLLLLVIIMEEEEEDEDDDTVGFMLPHGHVWWPQMCVLSKIKKRVIIFSCVVSSVCHF